MPRPKIVTKYDSRPYLMRRLHVYVHEDLEVLAKIMKRGKEDLARECMELGVERFMRDNGIKREG